MVEFKSFVTTAQKALVEATASGEDSVVYLAGKGAEGLKSKAWQRLGSRTNTSYNMAARQALIDSLKRDFGVAQARDLPKAVYDALKIGDFALDENDRVTSCRPLTARRILSVNAAVRFDKLNGGVTREVSRQAQELAKTAYRRCGAKEFLSAAGRLFMRAAHAVKSFFTLDVFRPSWQRNNVEAYAHKVGMAALNKDLTPLPPLSPEAAEPVQFDAHLVAVGTGFARAPQTKGGDATPPENVTVVPFEGRLEFDPAKVSAPKDRKWDPIYPAGRPRLTDIVQNPNLQDCWFLSSVTATLASKGPEAISRLIQRQDDGSFNVRLGGHVYNVPDGEVRCGGKSCVSDSAPWVKILEQAAAMHEGAKSYNLFYSFASIGLNLLSGKEGGGVVTVSGQSSEFQTTEQLVKRLQEAQKRHIPVVLGHVAPNSSVAHKIAGVLRDNISPGHAVTLLDVQPCGTDGKKAWLTVMDPYGHTRIISSDALERCEVNYGCSNADYEALKAAANPEENRVSAEPARNVYADDAGNDW